MRRNAKKPSVIKMILKTIFVLGMAIGWLFTAVSLVWMVFEEATDYYDSDAYRMNRCDEYYYEKDYAEMLDYMNLYQMYDEKYDVYWEVVDAYVDLQEYLKLNFLSFCGYCFYLDDCFLKILVCYSFLPSSSPTPNFSLIFFANP